MEKIKFAIIGTFMAISFQGWSAERINWDDMPVVQDEETQQDMNSLPNLADNGVGQYISISDILNKVTGPIRDVLNKMKYLGGAIFEDAKGVVVVVGDKILPIAEAAAKLAAAQAYVLLPDDIKNALKDVDDAMNKGDVDAACKAAQELESAIGIAVYPLANAVFGGLFPLTAWKYMVKGSSYGTLGECKVLAKLTGLN